MRTVSAKPIVSEGDFAHALLDADVSAPDGIVGPDGKPDSKRFNVYRNNVVVSLTEALSNTFPAIVSLLGDDYFSALARTYVIKHPPASPVLMWYGAEFPDFLDGFPPLADYPYLGDVARLEWAWLQSYHAKDSPVLDPATLGSVPPDNLGSVVFVPHPSAAVISSRWPVWDLVRANRFDPQAEAEIALDESQSVLVVRPDLEVDLFLLRPGGDVFVSEALNGATLNAAAEAAMKSDAGFDLSQTLSDCLSCGAFSGIELGA